MEAMKLTGKLMRRYRRDDDRGSLPTRDDFHPIDTREQEEIIRSFEAKHEQQSSLWRSVISTLLFCFALFLTYNVFQQTFWPWELRYHAYFMGEVDSATVVSAESMGILVCLMAARGLIHTDFELRQQLMWYPVYISLLLAIFWLCYMLRMPKFHWDVIWLPFGPMAAAGICLYVDHLLAESLEEIKKLRGYMYAYKAS